MADKSQRTEKPTAKHRKEMRDEGTVARSTELSGWASLLVAVSLLPWLGGLAANRVSAFVAGHHPGHGPSERGDGSGPLGPGPRDGGLGRACRYCSSGAPWRW